MNDLKEDFLEESRNKNEQNCSFEEFTLKEPKENTYNNLNYFSYETQGETPNNENQLNIINKVLKILIQKYIYLITMII